MYDYKATVKAVHDGDTITVDIDLGFNTTMVAQKLRLYGLNAPELKEADGAGIKAAENLQKLLPVGAVVRLKTIKDKKEKYGRWLAVIYADDAAALKGEGEVGIPLSTTSLNDKLLKDGWAIPMIY